MTENVSAAAGHPTFQQSYLLTRSIERCGDATLFPSLFGVDNISKDSQSFSISSLSPPMPQWSLVGTNFTFCHPIFSGCIWVLQVCHGCLAYLFSKRQVVIYLFLFEIDTEREALMCECVWECVHIHTMREISQWPIHSPQCLQQLGLSQAEAQSMVLNLGFPHGHQGLKYVDHHLLPPRVYISRKLQSGMELELEPR